MTVRVAAAVLVALAATSAYSQEPQPQPTSRNARELLNVVPDLSGRGPGDVQAVPMAEVPRPPEPPEGANSWSLIVHTTGGFTGRGVGTVTISSDGRMVCPAPCASLVETQMKLISSSVA